MISKDTLAVIVPILNEEIILAQQLDCLYQQIQSCQFADRIEVFLSDGGSTDKSRQIALEKAKTYHWQIRYKKLLNPSVAKTVALVFPDIDRPYCLVLPVDCELGSNGFNRFFLALDQGQIFDSGGFYKSYERKRNLMAYYAGLQNSIRTGWFKNLVWTNGMFFKTNLVKSMEFEGLGGFLEDVQISDRLKKTKQVFFKEKILVSPRLYYRRNPLGRILINALILFLYRTDFWSIPELKALYQKYR